MFRTRIKAMEEAADKLQIQLRNLNQTIEDVEHVKSNISQLSQMESVNQLLRRELCDLDRERRKLFILLIVLNQSARSYHSCEKGNLDYAEYNRHRKRNFTWYDINIDSVAADVVGRIIF